MQFFCFLGSLEFVVRSLGGVLNSSIKSSGGFQNLLIRLRIPPQKKIWWQILGPPKSTKSFVWVVLGQHTQFLYYYHAFLVSLGSYSRIKKMQYPPFKKARFCKNVCWVFQGKSILMKTSILMKDSLRRRRRCVWEVFMTGSHLGWRLQVDWTEEREGMGGGGGHAIWEEEE